MGSFRSTRRSSTPKGCTCPPPNSCLMLIHQAGRLTTVLAETAPDWAGTVGWIAREQPSSA